jgi:integrase
MIKIRLLKNVRLADGKWSLQPVVKKAGGHVKGAVVVAGTVEKGHAEGAYYLDYRYEGKRYRPTVASVLGLTGDAIIAMPEVKQAIARKQGELSAMKEHHIPAPQALKKSGHRRIRESIAKFLDDREGVKAPATMIKYRCDLELFRDWTSRTFVEEITADDLQQFQKHMLREAVNVRAEDGKGFSGNTVILKMVVVAIWLKSEGRMNTLKGVVLPTHAKPDRRGYMDEQLKKFFAVCDQEQFEIFQFLLGTGFRSNELCVAEWADIDWEEATIQVIHKPWLKFVPKGKEDRTVPIADGLLRILKARKAASTTDLIFPTNVAAKTVRLLSICKRIGERAGLTCGSCLACLGDAGRECGQCYIHKFRHTFGRRMARSGMDIPTLAVVMGHKDIKVTQIYAEGMYGAELRAKVNAGWQAVQFTR